MGRRCTDLQQLQKNRWGLLPKEYQQTLYQKLCAMVTKAPPKAKPGLPSVSAPAAKPIPTPGLPIVSAPAAKPIPAPGLPSVSAPAAKPIPTTKPTPPPKPTSFGKGNPFININVTGTNLPTTTKTQISLKRTTKTATAPGPPSVPAGFGSGTNSPTMADLQNLEDILQSRRNPKESPGITTIGFGTKHGGSTFPKPQKEKAPLRQRIPRTAKKNPAPGLPSVSTDGTDKMELEPTAGLPSAAPKPKNPPETEYWTIQVAKILGGNDPEKGISQLEALANVKNGGIMLARKYFWKFLIDTKVGTEKLDTADTWLQIFVERNELPSKRLWTALQNAGGEKVGKLLQQIPPKMKPETALTLFAFASKPTSIIAQLKTNSKIVRDTVNLVYSLITARDEDQIEKYTSVMKKMKWTSDADYKSPEKIPNWIFEE